MVHADGKGSNIGNGNWKVIGRAETMSGVHAGVPVLLCQS